MASDMKKRLLFVLIVMAAAAVCVSGCLGNDGRIPSGGTSDTSNNTSNNTSGGSSNSPDNDSNSTPTVPPFDANLSLVDPIPAGFTFLSTTTVKSHGQHIGVTDVLFGYQGIYHYGENNTPVYLTYYDTALSDTSKSAADYVQMMKDSHIKQYGNDSKITTVQINGHNATLLEVTTEEPPQFGRYILTWTIGDALFVTVTGTVDYTVLETLATATGY